MGSAAYRALDFTIGMWFVTVPGSPGSAASKISRDVRGCAIVERWSGKNDSGINIDAFNAEDNHWHRFFVDGYGKVHVFQGTVDGNSIHYTGMSTGERGQVTLNRLTISSKGRDMMTQLWEKSIDGKTWKTAFEGTYTRRTQP